MLDADSWTVDMDSAGKDSDLDLDLDSSSRVSRVLYKSS